MLVNSQLVSGVTVEELEALCKRHKHVMLTSC